MALTAEEQKQYVDRILEEGKKREYQTSDENNFMSLEHIFFAKLYNKYAVFVNENKNNKSYDQGILVANIATLATVNSVRKERGLNF